MARIKAQLYDKIHSVIGHYNDRMVRGIFQYNYDINTDILGDVLISFCCTSPIMHSSFHRGFFSHYWVERDFNKEDILFVKYTRTPYEDASRFICGVLPMSGNVQVKVAVFKDKTAGTSTVAILTNHMYMDGGDLKCFMKALCKAYNCHLENKPYQSLLKNGSRSYKTVYNDLNKDVRRKARWLYSNPTPKNTRKFGLTINNPSDTSFIITETIPSEYFTGIKDYGKKHNATVNDMILSAYFLGLIRLKKISNGENITISGAIDLRRYMADSENTGITNHSSYLPYTIKVKDYSFDEMLKEVNCISGRFKADPFTGLYGLPLLNLGFTLFPPVIADRLVKKFYNNPYIAMSNIGILNEDFYQLESHFPQKAFITGTVKYKPGIMVSLTTYMNEITLSMCCKGNEKDKDILKEFLRNIKDILVGLC